MDKQKIESIVAGKLDFAVELEFTQVSKNNSTWDCVTAKPLAGGRMAPCVYYGDDDTPETVAERIVAAFQDMPNFGVDPLDFCKRDHILAHVMPQLVAQDGNADFLNGKSSTTFLDLAVVYRVWINDDMSFLLREDVREKAGIDPQELHTAALDNLRKEVQVLSMMDMLRGHVSDIPDEAAPPLMVATTYDRRYGAATILLTEVQKALAARCGGDYWIIPSSIHEVLALPDDFGCPPEALADIIGDVNNTQVTPEERLNNHAYFYNNARGMIEL